MKVTTLVFPKSDTQILLGYKKRGFGKDQWNGFGGKVDKGETIREAAMRELQEESGLISTNLLEVAELKFNFQTGLKIITHVFFVKEFEGQPKETEEMIPQWFNFKDIPYVEMWADDLHWLPRIISGEKLKAIFYFDNPDDQNILKYEIKQYS